MAIDSEDEDSDSYTMDRKLMEELYGSIDEFLKEIKVKEGLDFEESDEVSEESDKEESNEVSEESDKEERNEVFEGSEKEESNEKTIEDEERYLYGSPEREDETETTKDKNGNEINEDRRLSKNDSIASQKEVQDREISNHSCSKGTQSNGTVVSTASTSSSMVTRSGNSVVGCATEIKAERKFVSNEPNTDSKVLMQTTSSTVIRTVEKVIDLTDDCPREIKVENVQEVPVVVVNDDEDGELVCNKETRRSVVQDSILSCPSTSTSLLIDQPGEGEIVEENFLNLAEEPGATVSLNLNQLMRLLNANTNQTMMSIALNQRRQEELEFKAELKDIYRKSVKKNDRKIKEVKKNLKKKIKYFFDQLKKNEDKVKSTSNTLPVSETNCDLETKEVKEDPVLEAGGSAANQKNEKVKNEENSADIKSSSLKRKLTSHSKNGSEQSSSLSSNNKILNTSLKKSISPSQAESALVISSDSDTENSERRLSPNVSRRRARSSKPRSRSNSRNRRSLSPNPTRRQSRSFRQRSRSHSSRNSCSTSSCYSRRRRSISRGHSRSRSRSNKRQLSRQHSKQRYGRKKSRSFSRYSSSSSSSSSKSRSRSRSKLSYRRLAQRKSRSRSFSRKRSRSWSRSRSRSHSISKFSKKSNPSYWQLSKKRFSTKKYGSSSYSSSSSEREIATRKRRSRSRSSGCRNNKFASSSAALSTLGPACYTTTVRQQQQVRSGNKIYLKETTMTTKTSSYQEELRDFKKNLHGALRTASSQRIDLKIYDKKKTDVTRIRPKGLQDFHHPFYVHPEISEF